MRKPLAKPPLKNPTGHKPVGLDAIVTLFIYYHFRRFYYDLAS